MKTFFIIASGIADIPDEEFGGKTPLMIADTPSLDALAKCGCCGNMLVLPDEVPLTRENAILSLLGYDFNKGIPEFDDLEKLGKSGLRNAEKTNPGYFVLPKFSGHGVVITSHPAIKGIGRMALLKPVEITIGTEDIPPTLRDKARAALKAIERYEFVMLHVECAASMSHRCDLKGKVEAIERIDRDIITPIADYVWNAKEQMNMVVVTDCVASWRTGKNERGEVPAVVYFNDDLPYDTKAFDEQTVADGPLNTPLPGDLIRKLVTFEPFVEDENPEL